MHGTHACTRPNCHEIFTRAYELKKHRATHDAPNTVFHCPLCDFISLQKKNLTIHIKNHTGEKDLQCPHMVAVGDSEQPCDYRTSDPAALTKHRKKLHGYMPPSNLSRSKTASAALRKTRQKMAEKVPRRRQRTRLVAPATRRRRIRAPRKVDGGLGHASTPPGPTPFLPLENMRRDVVGYRDVDHDFMNTTLVGTDDGIGLDALFDPSLRPEWMARYETSYSAFDVGGMKHQLQTLPEDSPFDMANLDARASRDGCLCPDWMVEAGIQGWGLSPSETHKQTL